jgi:hypothetical protein
MTKRLDGTILNRNKNVVPIVHNGQQQIQSKIINYVQNSVLSVEIVSFPFKWKVRRSHADFQTLRDYLLRKYPQTIIPPLPRYNQKKRLTVKQIVKKQVYYQRFLTAVLKSQVLRSC